MSANKPTRVAIVVDSLFLGIAVLMILWIVFLVSNANEGTPQWLLVPINILYVIVSLYIAAASFQSAAAANRAAQAMEDSLVEAKITRFAEYAPLIGPADAHPLTINADGSADIRLKNPFGQPARELQAYLFEVRADHEGKPEIQLSSMRESTSRDVPKNETAFTLHLVRSETTDDRRRIILNSFLEHMQRAGMSPPETFLLGLYYHHLGHLMPLLFTFDVKPAPPSQHNSS